MAIKILAFDKSQTPIEECSFLFAGRLGATSKAELLPSGINAMSPTDVPHLRINFGRNVCTETTRIISESHHKENIVNLRFRLVKTPYFLFSP